MAEELKILIKCIIILIEAETVVRTTYIVIHVLAIQPNRVQSRSQISE